jgi:drug/metabolite transporter (DMT)-like permease
MKKAFLQLHAAIFLAGFTGVLGRLITMNEGLLVWYRMFFSAVFLLALSLVTKKIKFLPWRQALPLIGIGAIVALHWVFFYGSVKYANVSVSLVCFSTMGFFSSFIDPLISKRKMDLMEVLLGLMVMLGVYLIFHFDQEFRLGILYGIVSSILGATFTILNKKYVDKHDAQVITFYELGGGWLSLNFILPFYLQFVSFSSLIPGVSDFLWLVVLSLLCTVLAFNLSIRALKKISPFTVNLSYNLEPVYGILLAFVIYQEHMELGFSFYVGLFIIFLTVVLQSARVWKTRGN